MSKFSIEKVQDGTPPPSSPTLIEQLKSQDGGMGRTETSKNLYLFEESLKDSPRITTFLQDQEKRRKTQAQLSSTSPSGSSQKQQPRKSKKDKLGTVFGVYLPTVQNIVGVIVFVRLGWMVGLMGVFQAFLMVFISCAATFLTGISVSAIATNGLIEGGGSYFMISRNLGPESGGAVGICFYFANTFAVILYILGALEILMTYMYPKMAVFGDLQTDPLNNYRVYGSITLYILFIITAFGVLFVQYFAPIALISVVVSILAMFIGGFESSEETRDIWICLLGDILLIPPENITRVPAIANLTKYDLYKKANIPLWCNSEPDGGVYYRYCSSNNGTEVCDRYFTDHQTEYVAGIPGITSGIISSNLWTYYMKGGEAFPGYTGSYDRGEVKQDITSSFVILTGIYFPSVTTVLAGTNFSGDLTDPQKSIPTGTIAAQLTTSVLYLALVLLYGSTGNPYMLRDKFGDSIYGEMFAAIASFPSKWLVLVGSFCSSFGAGLQSIASAPRLLQAVAQDEIIPFLSTFKHLTKWGEPFRALVITAVVIQLGIMIGKLDFVTPIISVFFLMCEAMVNLTCAILTLLNTPGWRPRFKYYHWFLSSVGVALNLIISFMVGWYYALIAFAICAALYKYIEYKGCEKEWGDGIRGLHLSAAQTALNKLKDAPPHTKNWRPQILILSLLENNMPKYPQLYYLAAHMKAGKGLTIAASMMKGDYLQLCDEVDDIKQNVKDHLNELKLDFFAKILCTSDIVEGLSVFIQTVGLGGLNPNTIIVAFPQHTTDEEALDNYNIFMSIFKMANARNFAFLVLKGVDNYPCENIRQAGTVDVWWIVHDGGMLVLLSFLMRQHKVWADCKLRIFTVATITDNSIFIKQELEKFLYEIRIEAEVFVEELHDSDVSEYVYDKTLDMQKRAQLLKSVKHARRTTTFDDVLSKAKSHTSHDDMDRASIIDKKFVVDVEADTKVPQVDQAVQDGGPVNAVVESDKKGPMHPGRYMRMHTAVRLNQMMRQHSSNASLIILNFPAPPKDLEDDENYIFYLETLTENLDRILLVRGSGREVVTIYS